MQAAPLHPLEERRLETLAGLGLLDTPPETEFQLYVELAASICKTPTSLLSLVDRDRQWFKAAFGSDAKETPRELSFCAHAILQSKVFEVIDAREDPRFADNPLVLGGPQVRSYAGAPVLAPNGMPIGTLCVFDVEPRKFSPKQIQALQRLARQVGELLRRRMDLRQGEQLGESLRYYRTAVEHMSDGVVLQDHTGAIVQFNPSALRILGLSEAELLGKTSRDPLWKCFKADGSDFHPEEHPAVLAISTGKPQRNVLMGVQTVGGDLRWIRITAEPIIESQDPLRYAAVTTFTDVTDQKATHARLLEAARLAALGEMAGSIAHEINTPLAVISACAEFLAIQLNEAAQIPSAAHQKVQKIQDTVYRISEIVRGLRSFAQDGTDQPRENLAVDHVIQRVAALCLERFRTKGIALELDFKDRPSVNVVSAQLSQVLISLLNNAYDAVSGLTEKWVRVSLWTEGTSAGNRVLIRVTDSGKGIEASQVRLIMRPFYSTKPEGTGLGVGLSVSKGIVESLGGRLRYERDGENTSFVIDLPEGKSWSRAEETHHAA